MARIDPRRARSRGFVEPPRRPGLFLQLVLLAWFLIRLAVAAAVTAAFAGLVGLLWFGFTMPEAPRDQAAKTDAIVVLTGGEERLETAYGLLQKGLANRMFVTGVDRRVTKPELLKRLGDPPQELAARIELGFRAANTRGNASETAAWFNSQNLKSLRLVTANYHMRRSLLLFRRALPDAEIVAHPVVPKHLAVQCRPDAGAGCEQWWTQRGGAEAVARELVKYIAAVFYIPLG
ncbi:MAG TPA: YdcF family protein [Alphaproteobacteria bacterium]|jgi:uncharacterized SAM-binding protein YcdF (DUF218 family)